MVLFPSGFIRLISSFCSLGTKRETVSLPSGPQRPAQAGRSNCKGSPSQPQYPRWSMLSCSVGMLVSRNRGNVSTGRFQSQLERKGTEVCSGHVKETTTKTREIRRTLCFCCISLQELGFDWTCFHLDHY
nr:neuropeptide-like protein C4orf48 homolog isoform X2 [Chelonoidis abingdonii]